MTGYPPRDIPNSSVVDFEKNDDDFGESGRREISDILMAIT